MRAVAYLLGVAEPDPRLGLPLLTGVPTDVAGMHALLRARGFDVSVRTGRVETGRQAVMQDLDAVVDSLRDGDLLIFYFSGHGLRVADVDADEADGWDEAIALSDGLLRDDAFRALWLRQRSGTRVVAMVDACHSETAVLGFDANREAMSVEAHASTGPYRLVLSACRDEERAFEGATHDRGGGVVSTKMLEVLRRDPVINYGELWTTVGTEIRDQYPSLGQTPRLRSSGPDSALLEAGAFKAT